MPVVKTQGTQLFTVWNGLIVRFKCLKKIGYGQDSFSKIDNTCLDAESKQYERGMRDPGEGSVGINYDDTNLTHDQLLAIAESGETLQWFVGSGHSKDEPTFDAQDPALVILPATRSWNKFKAYINPTSPDDIEVDALESYSFPLVRNSGVTRVKRTIPANP